MKYTLIKLREIIDQYKMIYEDKYKLRLEYLNYKISHLRNYQNNKEINKIFKDEIDLYLQNLDIIKEVINDMLINVRKYDLDDMYHIFDLMDEKYTDSYKYIEDIFKNLERALYVNNDYKFTGAKEKSFYLNEKDLINYKNYLHCLDLNHIKDFFIGEKVYSPESFNSVMSKAKILDIDVEENMDYFSVFVKEKGLKLPILPKIKDSKSCLINVYELTSIACLNHIEDIILCNDIANFYECLYKDFNRLVKYKTNNLSVVSKTLLKEYSCEPFLEQIEKGKYYKNKRE